MDKRLKHVTFTDSTKKKDASVKRLRKLRVVLVGDGFIGKTSMLLSYAADRLGLNYFNYFGKFTWTARGREYT